MLVAALARAIAAKPEGVRATHQPFILAFSFPSQNKHTGSSGWLLTLPRALPGGRWDAAVRAAPLGPVRDLAHRLRGGDGSQRVRDPGAASRPAQLGRRTLRRLGMEQHVGRDLLRQAAYAPTHPPRLDYPELF